VVADEQRPKESIVETRTFPINKTLAPQTGQAELRCKMAEQREKIQQQQEQEALRQQAIQVIQAQAQAYQQSMAQAQAYVQQLEQQKRMLE
jgi:hypothetical protein